MFQASEELYLTQHSGKYTNQIGISLDWHERVFCFNKDSGASRCINPIRLGTWMLQSLARCLCCGSVTWDFCGERQASREELRLLTRKPTDAPFVVFFLGGIYPHPCWGRLEFYGEGVAVGTHIVVKDNRRYILFMKTTKNPAFYLCGTVDYVIYVLFSISVAHIFHSFLRTNIQ